MRKIIAGSFITLDGVVEAPEKWNPPRLFQGTGQGAPLTLTHAHAHGNGVIALRCTPGHAAVATTLSEVSQCAS